MPPPLPHVSELVVLVTLLVRRFFLPARDFRSPVDAGKAPAADADAGAVAAMDPAAGALDENDVGDGLLAVFRPATISEHDEPDSGQSSSANVGG